jgi:hypothetical protein
MRTAPLLGASTNASAFPSGEYAGSNESMRRAVARGAHAAVVAEHVSTALVCQA